ncbi:HNH endonuclease signature motif containing protein [Halapricum desulfuricans]|uniref:DNA-binding transcriptional regulator, HxlR family n=1 Tax=Halapricum desulfuricans TaxID=2841257 RepID=A0A897P0D7_9EURY|nr:HNH endonuclease signature motif containing protein [Halapricum desulfuricans]QSG16403.1 DNA-binding transcriptional regulator, HxlR family [Halapricum desulfuricans]
MSPPEHTVDDTRRATDREPATQTASDGTNQPSTYRTTDTDSVNAATRREVLNDYGHRCQICGRRDPEHGGLATLQVHHIDRDPNGMDVHDPANLTVFCRSCHTWVHNRSTIAESPVELSAADRNNLLPQDIEILEYLEAHGPARTGDIVEAVSVDLTVTALRERLWMLMGLDNVVESRGRQLIDKDVETNEWGLPEQIANSSRGHIPDETQTLLQRVEDEQVRQALERGCSREDVAAVLGTTSRTTFTKEKRARALDFPLDAFSRGRPSASSPTDSDESVRDSERPAGDVDNSPAEDVTKSVKTASSSGSSVEAQDVMGRSTDETADDTDLGDVTNCSQVISLPVLLSEQSNQSLAELQESLPENICVSGVFSGP